ncbi:3',5'-cyclic-AMP phosphodiesterase [Vibrio sp. SS-MA-C1-2]|uniref:3',5'-cyclic-AMP phosphodiesterase n=1 Tax=Vibrio sp. SS-MA-C1-2 TaxID=2908646 RepID=UPI001F38D3C8|nr:3',5'-cyclic-AMP phosphodiesterase [Vibrio sp. SS-MA-C1-2]UJF19104.1 3',5'-cyclic-AMP phosphodiesterase [Vibrio sp. SS-MA-C1-2]
MSDFILPKTADDIVLLQITDTHLFEDKAGSLLGVKTHESFYAVLDAIDESQCHFDAILATGDITQDHSIVSYQHFYHGLSRWKTPCFWLPGNHDYQPYMRQVLTSPCIHDERHFLAGDKWLVVLLDSQVEGTPHGELSDEQLRFLRKILAQHSDRHAFISLHHHPLAAGSAWLDQHQLKNSDAFWDVVTQANNVNTVLCGHIHQKLDCYVNGVRVLASPSTCVQFLPDSNDFALDNKNPGWRIIKLKSDGSIQTSVERLEGDQFKPNFQSSGY